MMGQAVKTSPRLWARIAGGCYLITIIMGVFVEVFVRDRATATATNISAHESFGPYVQYSSGGVLDISQAGLDNQTI